MTDKPAPNGSVTPTDEMVLAGLRKWRGTRALLKEFNPDLIDDVRDILEAALSLAPATVSGDWVMVPKEPTEEMWGNLARDIVFWARIQPHDGYSLHKHLRSLGREIPDWLVKEIPPTNRVPPKGTVAACIYKAMLSTAPKAPASGAVTDQELREILYEVAGRDQNTACINAAKTWEIVWLSAMRRVSNPTPSQKDDVLGQELREMASSDHKRPCEGRSYQCSCGYDAAKDALLIRAANALSDQPSQKDDRAAVIEAKDE